MLIEISSDRARWLAPYINARPVSGPDRAVLSYAFDTGVDLNVEIENLKVSYKDAIFLVSVILQCEKQIKGTFRAGEALKFWTKHPTTII